MPEKKELPKAQQPSYEKENPMGAMERSPLESAMDGGSDAPENPSPLQLAANNSPQVMQLKLLQQNINAAMKSGVVQRNPVFKHNDTDYETEEGIKKDICEDSSTKAVSFTKDAAMPTPYKVIVDTYGLDNVETLMFTAKTPTFDRPRAVEAEIRQNNVQERVDTVTTSIGQMGNDELYVREGNPSPSYDGGHLIGAMILGNEAKYAYNIAPQESDGNRNSYNNTIEQAVRDLPFGSKVNYSVDLEYEENNYKVDQKTLKDRGILKALDHAKPWFVHIPGRIPKYWSANAKLTSGGNFGAINNDTSGRSKNSKQAVKDATPDLNTKHSENAFRVTGGTTKELNFFMQQYTPSDTMAHPQNPSSTNLDSLANAANYEAAPPIKSEILDALPQIGTDLERDANDYRAELMLHTGAVYLGPNGMPQRLFRMPNTYPTDWSTRSETRLNEVIGVVDEYPNYRNSNQMNSLRAINIANIFTDMYADEQAGFYRKYDEYLFQITPTRSSLISLAAELNRIKTFGTNNKTRLPLEAKSENTLREDYKEALKLKKRLAVIKAEKVNDRMGSFKGACEDFYSFCNNAPLQLSAFSSIFVAEITSRIQNALAGLPNYILMDTKPDRKRSGRAKRARHTSFKGMC